MNRQNRMRLPRFSFPVLSRDKADTLLLLAACISILLPHFQHVSWWVTASCTALLGWRTWLTLQGLRLPPAWVLLPVSALTMLGVYLQYHSFFGREAGVTMLMLLLTSKLLEMHARRDLFVVLFLSFFLMLTSYFYQQNIGSALQSLTGLSLLLTAQLSFQYTGLYPSLWQRFKLSLSILGLAIPLTLAAFFLFPRVQGPLWGLPGDARSGRSGLSESMAPGGISEMVLSEDIVFRVQFGGTVPNKSLLYWRGIVMDQFDGKTWTHSPGSQPLTHLPASYSGPAIAQTILLEPQRQRWLFALDLPASLPPLQTGLTASLNQQMELRNSESISQRLRYEITSYPQYRYQTALTAEEREQALQLPAGFNPRTANFASTLRQRYPEDADLINAILQFFRQQAFSYTLEPPLLGTHTIDDFLFESRAGFCEHYASTFTNIMRFAGIPARIVTGYQGGNVNTVDGYFEVRQSDAHAWSEVWLKERGWVRIDPTAAVAPERVMQNLDRAIPKRGFAGLMSFALSGNSWSQNLRMRWDAVNNSWNQWVLNYNRQTQLSLFKSFGLKEIDWAQLSLIFFIAGSLILALIALPLMWHSTPLPPVDRVYFLFCKKMARKQLPKMPEEGPLHYLQRLRQTLPAKEFQAAEQFLNLYIAAKYGKHDFSEFTLISRLKKLLAACP